MTAVEVQDVRKPVFELPLDGVIKREEAVTREMPFLVKPDCPRIGAEDVEKDGFTGVMIL